MEARFEQALTAFETALKRLLEVCAVPEDAIVRDALIQRFEFSFEAGWKAAYRWLKARGIAADESAYSVIPVAFTHQLLLDAAGWSAMRAYRNKTSHTYDEAIAIDVAAFVRGQGLGLLQELANTLRARADE